MIKRKEKKRHTFWKHLNFKYRLSILNENTLEEIWKLRVSMLNGILLYLTSFFLLMVVASVIIVSTPLRNYLPGYLDSEIREGAIKLAIKTDSLETKQRYQDEYIQNIKDIFAGKVQPGGESNVDTVMIAAEDKSLQSSDREKEFNEQYEEEEKYNLTNNVTSENAPTEGVTFFRPVKGVISKKYNVPSMLGVDISTAGESVVATLSGAIAYAGYDPEADNVVIIQHKNGFVSIYKGVSMLLKKTGDVVRTGEAIGFIESEKQKTLHFELWYKSRPINPELYISF